MKRVLVTAIGSAVADIVIKQLHKSACWVVGTDIYPKEWVADAYNVDSFYQVSTCVQKDEYVGQILNICKKESISYIIPLTDVEVDLYNQMRHIFENEEIIVCISCKKTVDLCRNKANLSKYLSAQNLCPVIPELDIMQIECCQEYPIICKPINGRSSNGIVVCNCYEEVKCFLECHHSKEYIMQPYIKGKIITVDVLRNSKTKQCIVYARKELLRTGNGLGTTVRTFFDSSLVQECQRIADALNINGCVNYEFIEDESGDKYFMECNPRFSGGLEFSVLSGYDFINNHLKCFCDEDIDVGPIIKEQIIARKYEEYVTRCYE